MKKYIDIYWFLKKVDDFTEKYEVNLTKTYFSKMVSNEYIGGARVKNVNTFLDFLSNMDVISISKENIVNVTSKGKHLISLNNSEKYFLNSEQKQLITSWIISLRNDDIIGCIAFYKECLKEGSVFRSYFPKKFQQLIDDLIFLEFFDLSNEIISLRKQYSYLLATGDKKLISLKDLKDQLERQELIGNMAEDYVVEYEKKRLSQLNLYDEANRIEHISLKWANLGYDIRSFSNKSRIHNRFIEVKALNNLSEFYWTINELNVAMQLKEHYFLYLVEIKNSRPIDIFIIQNPYDFIKNNAEMVSTQFKVTLNTLKKDV